MLYHDSHDIFYRCPLGPPAAGSSITLRFRCDEGTPVLRIWDGHEILLPMDHIRDDIWQATAVMPAFPQLCWYNFVIHRQNDTAYYGNNPEQLGGVGCYWNHQPPSYQLTVYDPTYHTPDYLHHGVLYQIFPDRYCRLPDDGNDRENLIAAVHPEATFHHCWEDAPALDIDPVSGDNRALDFFGGTLRGIEAHLSDLKEMGITLLYLNPIFQSRTNHRYDTGDYHQIDPILGSKADFDSLVETAKQNGIRVLLDGVFSHTGSDSRYFNRFCRYDSLGAFQSRESPYAGWYQFEEFPQKYRSWWGFDTLPAIDKNNPDYQHFLLNQTNGVLPGWIRSGACGWRLDVADELPVSLLQKMRKAIHQADENAVLLGEVWEDASNKVTYGEMRSYCLGDTLDSVMNYPLRREIIDFFTGIRTAYDLRRLILHQREVYPVPFLYSLMNLLGSHDRVRILNAMAGYDRPGSIQMDRTEAAKIKLSPEQLLLAGQRYLKAMQLICALPGMPALYYGDEIGMSGMSDPSNRAPMAWKHADSALRGRICALLKQRNENALLQTGFLSVEAPDADTLSITRFSADGKDVFGQSVEEKSITVTVSRR